MSKIVTSKRFGNSQMIFKLQRGFLLLFFLKKKCHFMNIVYC